MRLNIIQTLSEALLVLMEHLCLFDDAFEGGDVRKLQIVHPTVTDYEHALRQKSDSIIRAERRKAEELR